MKTLPADADRFTHKGKKFAFFNGDVFSKTTKGWRKISEAQKWNLRISLAKAGR